MDATTEATAAARRPRDRTVGAVMVTDREYDANIDLHDSYYTAVAELRRCHVQNNSVWSRDRAPNDKMVIDGQIVDQITSVPPAPPPVIPRTSS
jgi:hypothetical protein